jgi:hypothetical protein
MITYFACSNLLGVGGQIHAAAGSAGNKDEAKNREADGYIFPAEASYVGGTF